MSYEGLTRRVRQSFVVVLVVALFASPSAVQEKGGEDETGADSFGGRTQKFRPKPNADRSKLIGAPVPLMPKATP